MNKISFAILSALAANTTYAQRVAHRDQKKEQERQ